MPVFDLQDVHDAGEPFDRLDLLDTFVFWPTDSAPAQAELFAREVLPVVRARVADQRTAAPLDR